MGPLFRRLRRFSAEAKRRKVYRVAATYVFVGFFVIEAADLVFPRLGIPFWANSLVVVLTLLGFPLALVLAWAFEVTPGGVHRTSPSVEEQGREAPSRAERRLRMALGSLIALIVAGAGAWYLAAVDEPPGSAAGELSVAVLPFQVSGAAAPEWRDGMVTMLSTNLDGLAGFRAIPDRTVLASAERRIDGDGDGGRMTSGDAVSFARDLNARFAIVGSAVTLGDELRFSAQVHETGSGRRLGRVKVDGSPDSVTALADALTRRLLRLLLEREQRLPSVDLGAITSRSLPALKHYLGGERAFREGRFVEAKEAFRAAVEEDTSFALAYARLATADDWTHTADEVAFRARERAYEMAERLPLRERRLVRVRYLRTRRPHSLALADSLRRLASDYPDDPAVWYEVGEYYLHEVAPRSWPRADSAFMRAVELDPGAAPYHHHAVDLAFALHHDSALAAQRIGAHPPGPRRAYYRRVLALVFGSADKRAETLRSLDTTYVPSFPLAPFALAHPVDGPLLERALQRLAERGDGDGREIAGWLLRVRLFQGQLTSAAALLKQEPLPRDIQCSLAGALGIGLPVFDAFAPRHLDPSRMSDDAEPAPLVCAGFYLVDSGATDDLPALHRRIRRAVPPLDYLDREAWANMLVAELKGYEAWKAGEIRRAAQLWSTAAPSPAAAIWRGDVHRQLGELVAAEGWYLGAWTIPLAHERLGRLYEEMGELEKAVAAYERFLEAWKGADEALQPRARRVRERIAGLSRGGATH